MGCAGQVGNPLLPGTKSKMLPDTDFTHQQYYEVGCTNLYLCHVVVPAWTSGPCIPLWQYCMPAIELATMDQPSTLSIMTG